MGSLVVIIDTTTIVTKVGSIDSCCYWSNVDQFLHFCICGVPLVVESCDMGSLVVTGVIITAVLVLSMIRSTVFHLNSSSIVLDKPIIVSLGPSSITSKGSPCSLIITSEEEAKARIAEKRREMKEQKEREAEAERLRLEEEKRLEEEQRRKEEEEMRQMERLAEEGRRAEEERIQKAIQEREEEERKAKEEEERLKKEKEETEKKPKKEEEERLARKKRIEEIMARTRGKTAAPAPKEEPTPTTPSPPQQPASLDPLGDPTKPDLLGDISDKVEAENAKNLTTPAPAEPEVEKGALDSLSLKSEDTENSSPLITMENGSSSPIKKSNGVVEGGGFDQILDL